MEESSTNRTTQEKGPLERCAELATWYQIEGDPAQKERLAAELAQCVMLAAKEEADRRAEQEAKDKADAEKAAKAEKKEQEAKVKENAEAKAKAAEVAEHAAWEKSMLESQERDREQRSAVSEVTRERTIEIPESIRNNPLYQQILEEQRATQARLVTEQADRIAVEARANNYQGLANQYRIDAADAREEKREAEQRFTERQDPATPGVEKGDPDPYAQAAKELDAKPMKEGQEVEGTIVEATNVDGRNYYVVEQDGERFAVQAGEKPEHEKGDEITASRTRDGFETAEDYGYGR